VLFKVDRWGPRKIFGQHPPDSNGGWKTGLPRRLWEPAAGNGAIVQLLRAADFDVVGSDLVDYGGAGITAGVNYLTAPRLA
jgi:hypothetical protein